MDQQSKTLQRHGLLSNIFTDKRFLQIDRWNYFIEVDGAKIGVAVATLNPGFFEYALNKAALDRVLAALRKGKIDEGYVVLARVSESHQSMFTGYRETEELHRQITEMGLQPRHGSYGDFYTLPSSLTMSDDEPM
jgi:hypothetical protein